jgi:hypothetical protein
MFSAGTRVYVCCSSITGKKLGPKRHSLGYASGGSAAYFINYNKSFPVKNQSFVICPIKVVFTRYGKEEKERSEARDFLHILPVFEDPNTTNIPKKLEEIMNILKGDELSKNSLWYDIGCNYSSDPSNIGTLIPVGSANVGRMEGNEARAWVTSILRFEPFKHLIVHSRHLPTLQAMIDTELLIWLSNAVKGSSARRDLLLWAEEDRINMVALVSALHQLMATYSKRTVDNQIQLWSNLKAGRKPDLHAYLSWLTQDMFGEKEIFDRKLATSKKISLDSQSVRITKNMDLVRSTYLSLKPKYV